MPTSLWEKHAFYEGDEPLPENFFTSTGAPAGDHAAAAAWHLRQESDGDPACQWRAGMMFMEADGVAFSIPTAARLFLHSAINEGDVAGMKVATLHVSRPAVPASEQLGLADWIQKGPSASSDDECMYRAGLMFLDGDAVPRDPETGILFLRQAAAEGHVPAMVALARARLDPENDDPFPEEAVEFFLEAAEAGYPEAMVTVGSMLRSGSHGPHDPDLGLHWIRQAALAGDPEGLYRMGLEIAETDGKGAAVYLEKALQGGLAGTLASACCMRLAMIHKAAGRRLQAIEVLERGLTTKVDGRLSVLDDTTLGNFFLADLDQLWTSEAVSRADDDNDEYEDAIAYAEAKRAWLPIEGKHCPLLLANLGILYKNDEQEEKAVALWREALTAHIPAAPEPGEPEWEHYQTLLEQVRGFLTDAVEGGPPAAPSEQGDSSSAHRLAAAYVAALEPRDKRCFVATACYGDVNHPDVESLRVWRDRSLLRTGAGAAAVRSYYWLSPSISHLLVRFPRAARAVRTLILEPWVRRIVRANGGG